MATKSSRKNGTHIRFETDDAIQAKQRKQKK